MQISFDGDDLTAGLELSLRLAAPEKKEAAKAAFALEYQTAFDTLAKAAKARWGTSTPLKFTFECFDNKRWLRKLGASGYASAVIVFLRVSEGVQSDAERLAEREQVQAEFLALCQPKPTTLYLVMGESGEYEDWQKWPVRVFANQDQAARFATAKNAEMDATIARLEAHGYNVTDGALYTVQPVEYEA